MRRAVQAEAGGATEVMTPQARLQLQRAFNQCEALLIRQEVRVGRMDFWEGWRRCFNMGYRGRELAKAAGIK